jgi:acylglycerol lipase
LATVDVAKLRAEYAGPHELVTTSDGKTLFMRRWTPNGAPKVSVLILHGITAYSKPYGPLVAEQLANEGYDVFAMDLRGHGLSDGKRGDYPSRERLLSDLGETLAMVRPKSKKLVLMGHSLGALSAIMAANANPGAIDGLVLVSAAKRIRTGVYPRPKTGARLKALLGVALLRGTPLIEYRREGQVGLDDPLFNFSYSARFYSILYGASALKVIRMFNEGLIDSPNLRFDAKLRVPLFTAVGDQDELFTVDAVKEFCDGIDCDDKEFHPIRGMKHAAWPKDAYVPLADWLGRKF